MVEFLPKYTSLDSIVLNPLDILARQNWVGKLTFLLSALLSALKLKTSCPLRNQ